MDAIGKQRDEIPEHVACAREAVQQQERRGMRRAGLAIEDLQSVHVDGSIVDGSHRYSPGYLTSWNGSLGSRYS